MRWGVVTFPGSNCDADARHVLGAVLGCEVVPLWHKEADILGVDAVVIPGGFSFGDYLRCGAIARFSPVMEAVARHAAAGGLVLGICNGFQVLCEAGLLPGVLLRNRDLRFVCEDVRLRVTGRPGPWTRGLGSTLVAPIAHAEGCWFVAQDELRRLDDAGQIAFRYCDADGRVDSDANPNGALGNVAGVTNAGGNVLGMMPHPERNAESLLGDGSGLSIFAAARRHWEGGA
jgi:phosphoribosylformylglycinamidine synthase